MTIHPPRRAHARPAQPGGSLLARTGPAPTPAPAPGIRQRLGPMPAPAAPTRKAERAAASPAEEPLTGSRAGPAVPMRAVEVSAGPAVPTGRVEQSAGPAVLTRAVERGRVPAVPTRAVEARAGPARSTIRVERGTGPVVSTSGGERGTVRAEATGRVRGAGRAVSRWELASVHTMRVGAVPAEGRRAGRAGAGPSRRVAQPGRGVRGGRRMTGRPGALARRMPKGRRGGRHGTPRRPGQVGVRRAIEQLIRGQRPLDPGPATASLEAPRRPDPAGPEPLGPATGDSNRPAAGRAHPQQPGGRAAGVVRGPRRQPGQRAAGRRSLKGRPLMGERRSGSTRR